MKDRVIVLTIVGKYSSPILMALSQKMLWRKSLEDCSANMEPSTNSMSKKIRMAFTLLPLSSFNWLKKLETALESSISMNCLGKE